MTGIEALLGVYAATGLVVGFAVGYAVRGRRLRSRYRGSAFRDQRPWRRDPLIPDP